MNLRLIFATFAGCVCAGHLVAQEKVFPPGERATLPGFENRRAVRAVRLKQGESIKLDGRVDESVWARAQPATDFVQNEPANGQAATEGTEVRVLFDSENLYLGVICHDSEPAGLRRNQMVRDGFLPADDRFMWTIDPFLNGRSGYFFETNPSGVMSDSLMVGASSNFGGGGGNDIRGWDGIWDLKVHRGDFGWSLEIAIPFRTLAFDPSAPAWGINFQRTVKRRNEDSLWSGWGRDQNLRRMSNAGLLLGLEDISQGHGLTLQPYLIGKFQDGPTVGIPQSLRATGGLDVTYSITPQLKANLTLNTDFAETEVDQRQVNLTQFALFFPEKRTFFLEGSNFLSFGREPDTLITPYFSRNIGLGVDGSPQRIDFGAKVTGQIGAYDVGFLQAQTGDTRAISGEQFTVFRGRRRFFKQSYAGVIFTRRADRSGALSDAYTAGADFSLATSQFHGSRNLELSGFYLWDTDVAKVGNNRAWGMRLDYPNDRWNMHTAVREVGVGWNPAVGFLQRNDIRNYNNFLRFSPRPRNTRFIRRFGFHAWHDFYTDLRNVTRSSALELQVLGVEFQTGDNFQVQFVPSYESPSADFAISDGVVLPQNVGYHFFRTRFSGGTSQRRKISTFSLYSFGTFYSGHRREVFSSVGLRPRPGVQITVDYNWNRIELAQGNFTTSIDRLNTNYQFTTRLGIANSLQYDNVSRNLGWQSRFRWIVHPGNDVYIVYSHNWLDVAGPNGGFSTQSRSAASKIIYTKQF